MTTELPDSYMECAETAKRAAYAYARAHPFAQYVVHWHPFEVRMARAAGRDLGPHESAAIAGSVRQCLKMGLECNTAARGMLEAMAAATDDQATYMMAKAIFMEQLEAQAARATKQIAAPGNWQCIACPQKLDAYTPMDLKDGEGPTPGSLCVCAGCGAIQRVNRAGNGYEDLPVRDLNRLPKSVRTQLLHTRNNILHALQLRAQRAPS